MTLPKAKAIKKSMVLILFVHKRFGRMNGVFLSQPVPQQNQGRQSLLRLTEFFGRQFIRCETGLPASYQ